MENIPRNFILGFTLLEFLIAFGLSVFILTGIYKIYIFLFNQYHVTQNFANFQHQGQLVYLTLKNNIQLAGNAYCLPKNTTEDLNPIVFKNISLSDQKAGTDVLSIHRCIRFENKIQWKTISFFIKNTHRKTTNNRSIFSLYRKIGTAPSEELIPGISNMRICYMTSDRQILHCAKANQPLKHDNIAGVRIQLSLDAFASNSLSLKNLHKNLVLIVRVQKEKSI